MSHFSSTVTLVLASAKNRDNILAWYLGFRRQVIREERALERIPIFFFFTMTLYGFLVKS